MSTLAQWFGILIGAIFYGVIAHFIALFLNRSKPAAARGLYRSILLKQAPDDNMVALVRFVLLFLIAGILRFWIGPLAPFLLPLAWICYNVFRSSQSDAQPGPGGGEQPLSFTLRTTSGPNVRLGNPFRGTFIAGGAGSGKSKSIIEPILQQAGALGLTGVVYDFKFPTLAEEVAGSYQGTAVKPY